MLVIGDLRDPVAVDRAIRAAESGCLVIATVSAGDAASALMQLVATIAAGGARRRSDAALRRCSGPWWPSAWSPAPTGEGRIPIVEWMEPIPALREALAGGGEVAALQKALERATKEGKGETFAQSDGRGGLAGI